MGKTEDKRDGINSDRWRGDAAVRNNGVYTVCDNVITMIVGTKERRKALSSRDELPSIPGKQRLR